MDSQFFSLSGKVAIVTGAASGIGLETARLFAALGADLVLTDIDEAGLATAAGAVGGNVRIQRHDVTSEADWSRVYAFIAQECGRLDVLVNNAGIMVARPFVEAGIEVLRRQLQVNVESVYLGMQGAVPLMRQAITGGARNAAIVNVASIYGKVAGSAFAAYSATKGAVRALSKAVAIELAQTGIRVNAVLPGPVATNLSATWDPPRDALGNVLSAEEALAQWARLIPMGRLGMTEDIAPLIAFLASDAAGFITGSEFVADGGYTAA